MTTDDGAVPSRTPENLLTTGDEQLRDLIYGSMSAEFASSVNEKPATFPLTPFYDDDRGVVVITSPVAFAKKADAVRSTVAPNGSPLDTESTLHTYWILL